ncbi:MAG: PRC-barrel domain-containing protein [Candidatus Pacearchaeota archaeon]|nr:PRC-barrel domain-containing protein [Candidatus Pacearchaeota archaeon]
MLKILKISEVVGMKVFTDGGDFIGTIEEANLLGNRVESWRVRVAKNSSVGPYLSGAKGLIIPHQYIKAFGEVVIISKTAIPKEEAESIEEIE